MLVRNRYFDYRSRRYQISADVDPDFENLGIPAYAPIVEHLLPREAVQAARQAQAERLDQ